MCFMQPEVMFLCYRVNKDGLFPLHEKVDFKNAESQKSVTELKSYIGSVNYGLWITITVICQNSSKILEPLKHATWILGEKSKHFNNQNLILIHLIF